MRALGICLLAAAIGAAQTPTEAAGGPAVVRGVLLERDAQPEGEFSVRRDDHQVFRYRFDRKTYVEREGGLIEVRRLNPGDKVEVLSDVVPASVLRYARSVHVLEDPPPGRRDRRARAGTASWLDDGDLLLLGNQTISGVVIRVTAERLTLHTRNGEEAVALRPDTRFLQGGEVVDASDLKPNTRVFVRVGDDLDGRREAYQVVWGAILAPN